MKKICLLCAFLLIPTTNSAGQVILADSSATALLGVAAWDIEFHFVTSKGEYIQQLSNPYDDDAEGIGVFDNGRLSAYYFRLRGRCYTGLPSRYMGSPHLLISPASCRMFLFFDEQIWLVRAGVEKVRLEDVPRKT